MCRVLILDDNLYGAQTVQLVLQTAQDTTADIALQLEDALEFATQAIKRGKPYEVFLIDQQLGVGKNGIEAMCELRNITPDADAIIFTGYGNSEDGLKAYRAGAFRYLAKPYDNQELLFLLEALTEVRKTKREHGWQKIFSEMMEAALKEHDFHAMSDVVVKYCLKLGFERAHLFWVPTHEDARKDAQMIGITCAGKECINPFADHPYHLRDWYDLNRTRQTKNAVFIPGTRTETLRHQIESEGYRLPAAEAAILPLWRDTSLIGALMLDFGQINKSLSEHERSLLNFFSRQVSVVLHQAKTYDREQRALQESNIIRNIGRQITTKAASASLTNLLEEVRKQIGQLMDVSNFTAILLDEDNHNEIIYQLLYKNGRRRKGLRRPSEQRLEDFLLTQKQEIFLNGNVNEYLVKNNLQMQGNIPTSWLGAPLRVNDKVIGGLVIHQNSSNRYREHDRDVLVSVADQVAGAIQISRLSEAEQEDARRMQVLQNASVDMLRIARENQENLWLTVLTLATADFGIGFNRALLFLAHDNHSRLLGQTAIGTENGSDAGKDWENDIKRGYNFQKFLAELGTKRMRHTEFEETVRQVEIIFDERRDAVSQVMRNVERMIIQEEDVPSQIPPEITRHFSLATCALLPLRAGKNTLGVVIVDNKHNQKPLSEKALNRLQILLDNAGLVWETLREGKKSESLLDANHEILGRASHQNLAETLNKICIAARTFSEADWAIIYPIWPGKTPPLFDMENLGYDGKLHTSLDRITKEQPSADGIASKVLKDGTLKIGDIDADKNAKQLKLSEHHFIKDEGVKALIGTTIFDQYNHDEALGLLYLDYRKPRQFSDVELHHARSFASLAGVAISNARQMDELRKRRQLKAIADIVETVGTGLELEAAMEAVLEKLNKFFEETRLCVLFYNDDQKALKFAPATLKFYKIHNPRYKKLKTFQLGKGTIACRVAQMALDSKEVKYQYATDVSKDPDYLGINQKTQSELCISLMGTSARLLGVLALERQELNGFSDDDIVLAKTVAQQLSIVIERAQQSDDLAFKTTVASQTSWAADIAHDISNEVGQIRTWTYLIGSQAEEGSALKDYSTKIDESATRLMSAGPWSDESDRVMRLDEALTHSLDSLPLLTNIELETSLGAEGLYIKVNLAEFQRVLKHLVRNAVRAMSDLPNKKIKVATCPLGKEKVEILFKDFGPGIPEDIRLSIFQRPITTKKRGGFGLLLIREMIEDMGGSVKLVETKRGQGAEFSIQLPAINPDQEMGA